MDEIGVRMTPGRNTVLTVGHSNHPLDRFMGLLRRHAVTAVADVRSAPYSRFNPRFDRETLGGRLNALGVAYLFLGRALGGRPDDRSCYENGRVRYDRLARTPLFREGIERVVRESGNERVALMCAEKEPLDCHRALLVGRALVERGVAVAHILADGTLEPDDKTMDRLLASMKLPGEDLFRSRRASIAEAIARKAGRVAHADGASPGGTARDAP